MPKVQLVGGAFQDAEGTPVAYGILRLELSQDAVTIDSGNEQVAAGYTVEVQLDANGNVVIDTPAYVWPNDDLAPNGTFYMATVSSAQGQIVWGPNAQQVTSPGPFNLGGWVPGGVNIIGPSFGITVGPTTTLPPGSNATVINAGTATNPILDFGIPAGANGTPAVPNTASLPLTITGGNIALTGTVPVVNGGTGATTAADARANLGISTAGGDLSGTYPNPTVSKVNGVGVTGAPATNHDVIVGINSTSAAWRQLTADDLLPGFGITSFLGGMAVEVGVTVTNPTFSAAYNRTPNSATITNSDGINSPLALTSPFTSVTVTGSFAKTSVQSTAFTLTAVQTSTQSAVQQISWLPRTFGGVGVAGAASATATGSNATLNTGAVLANAGLSATSINQVFGPYNPSLQKVYLLLGGSGHVFKDTVTGFAFVFNTPTLVSFINQYGVTVPMYLYESTNTLTGTFSITVVS